MTKDGRPSRFNDIRYFHGLTKTYLNGCEEAVAFGKRLAWYLNGEDFSVGAHPALYMRFTSSLPVGTLQVTDQGDLWWHRFVDVHAPADFPNFANADAFVSERTVEMLCAIKPDQTELITRAAQIVSESGESLVFPVKRQKVKKGVVEVCFSIATWPLPSKLHISITDDASGGYREAPPLPLRLYHEAFDLAGSIKVSNSEITVSAKPSYTAELTSRDYGGPLTFPLGAFAPAPKPPTSQLVTRNG